MRSHVRLGACSAGVVLLAAMTAWGAPTFTYTENFNDWQSMVQNGAAETLGRLPIGWWCLPTGEVDIDPQVLSNDGLRFDTIDLTRVPDATGCWGAPGGCYSAEYGSGIRPYPLGNNDYSVPWSGTPGDLNTTPYLDPPANTVRNPDYGQHMHSGRFTIQHPNWETFGRAGQAWYTGIDNLNNLTPKHEGTYPMDLQNNSMKASFDLSIRNGNGRGPGDGGTFAVQAVADINNFTKAIPYRSGALLGWQGTGADPIVPGFAIQFDLWPNLGQASADFDGLGDNSVGINVALRWDRSSWFSSLTNNVDTVGKFPFYIYAVGDNNQPIHVTVYYNDPAEGGLGVVRVYMKVDPATKAAGDPPVPSLDYNGQIHWPPAGGAYSYGMDTGHPDGQLVLEQLVGAWPVGTGGVFGYTAACGWATHIFAVDNVAVQTDPVTGTSPNPVALGPTFSLPVSAKLADDMTNLTQPGWDVELALADGSLNVGQGLGSFKQALAWARAAGLTIKTTAEPDLNYVDDSGADPNNFGWLPAGRAFPGFGGTKDHDWFGIMAKGYIYFPAAGDYAIGANSDNGLELIIGAGTPGQVKVFDSASNGIWGNGSFDVNQRMAAVRVTAPGVYPIQILYEEQGGGASCELYRVILDPTPNLLGAPVTGTVVRLGPADANHPDQPLIFGLLNGVAAPEAPFPFAVPPSVTLSGTQRIGGAVSAPGWNLKEVTAPLRLWSTEGYSRQIFHAVDEAGQTTALQYLEYFNDESGVGATPVINFRGDNGAVPPVLSENPIPGSYFPGLPTGAGMFGLRADGYAVLAAGDYTLSLVVDDDCYLRFGNQTIAHTGLTGSAPYVFTLHVTDAGTYPIRVEAFGAGAPNRIAFYQHVPGVGAVEVGNTAAGSTIAIYRSVGPTPFAWAPYGRTIPADRMVAPLPAVPGTAGPLGWTALATQHKVYDNWFGPFLATAEIENNSYYAAPLTGGGPTEDAGARATILVDTINYWDVDDATSWYTRGFPAGTDPRFLGTKRYWGTDFPTVLVAANNEHFGASFTGYIEFPAAGQYMFNMQLDDSGQMWIAGQVVTTFRWNAEVAVDAQPVIVNVPAPGIYDIRVDNLTYGWQSVLSVFEYLPDGSTALVGDPAANVTVYSSLNTPPPAEKTVYHNPVRLPASDWQAPLANGLVRGFHVQVVDAVYEPNAGDGNIGLGHDTLYTLDQAHELLASVLDGVPSLNQHGRLTFDGNVDRIAFNADNRPTWDFWPGHSEADVAADPTRSIRPANFALRVTGYLAMKAGGHLFTFNSDVGVTMSLGSQTWRGGSFHGSDWNDGAYFYVPRDGMYSLRLECYGDSGYPNYLHLIELEGTRAPWDGNWEFVNWPFDPDTQNNPVPTPLTPITLAYTSITPCNSPSVDADGDHDVDLADFGVFQACFTGGVGVVPLTNQCACFDLGGTSGEITAEDFDAFMNCWTGPSIPWTPSVNCP